MSLSFYGAFEKRDNAERMVYGYVSTEAKDSDGEVVAKSAIEGAWSDYMEYANVREMHQPSAVGIVKEYRFDEKGAWVGAYIADDDAWKKVKAKVYKGFSIGGKKLTVDGNIITSLRLSEISLVDRPANPGARIELFKMEDCVDEHKDTPVVENDLITKVAGAYDKLAEAIEKFDAVRDDLLKAANARADELQKSVDTLRDENKALSERLEVVEKAPVDDGVRVAVSKAQDTGGADEVPKDALGMIRKLHASGAQFFR
jgi:phage head maturation protease